MLLFDNSKHAQDEPELDVVIYFSDSVYVFMIFGSTFKISSHFRVILNSALRTLSEVGFRLEVTTVGWLRFPTHTLAEVLECGATPMYDAYWRAVLKAVKFSVMTMALIAFVGPIPGIVNR